MLDILKPVAKAFLRVLEVTAIIILGIPFAIITFLIPRGVWKPLIRMGVLLLVYQFVFPKRHPVPDFERAWHFLVGLALNAYGYRQVASKWLNDSSHIALLGALGTAIGFMYKSAKDRAKERQTLLEKFDKHTPDVTVFFTLSADDGTVCTLVNVGAGTAISVRFRFYVLDDRLKDDDNNPESFIIRSRQNVLIKDDMTRIWRVKEAHEYPYLLPYGRQPRAIPLGIVPTKPSYEIRVEIEYRDRLDRTVFKYAHGGQSANHELMSVGKWFRTGKPRRVYWHSDFGELREVAKFYFGRMLPVWSPTIEAEGKLMRRNVLRWFEKRGIEIPESERDE